MRTIALYWLHQQRSKQTIMTNEATLRKALRELVSACKRYDENPDSSVATAAYQEAVRKAEVILSYMPERTA